MYLESKGSLLEEINWEPGGGIFVFEKSVLHKQRWFRAQKDARFVKALLSPF